MVWSAAETRPHDGFVRQAAAEAGSPNAAPASGRCETASTRASPGSTPAANTAGNFATSTYTSVPSAPPATGYGR